MGLIPLTKTVGTPVLDDDGEFTGVVQQEQVEGGIGQPLRTLYLQTENSAYSMEKRLAYLYRDRGGRLAVDEYWDAHWLDLPEEGYLSVVAKVDFNLHNHVERQAIIEVARSFDIVVFDSVYRFIPSASLNDEVVAKQLMNYVEEIQDSAKLVMVIGLHHSSTKGEGGKQKGRESMGSTYFTSAWPDH